MGSSTHTHSDIKEKIKEWGEETKGRERQLKNSSNIEIKRLYTPLDVESFDYLKELNFSGCYPFTRGAYPTMYRTRLWTMRQYAGFGSAKETNERYRYLLSQGQTGLSVAFDLPTQIGMDSDNEFAAGEVGKVGVTIDSVEDMDVLFSGIGLDKISTSMTINSPASVLLAMYIAIGEKNGIEKPDLKELCRTIFLKSISQEAHIYTLQRLQ
jgi:Methylmalonyl-CoA mutase, N-terminal domain/subunit